MFRVTMFTRPNVFYSWHFIPATQCCCLILGAICLKMSFFVFEPAKLYCNWIHNVCLFCSQEQTGSNYAVCRNQENIDFQPITTNPYNKALDEICLLHYSYESVFAFFIVWWLVWLFNVWSLKINIRLLLHFISCLLVCTEGARISRVHVHMTHFHTFWGRHCETLYGEGTDFFVWRCWKYLHQWTFTWETVTQLSLQSLTNG